MKNHVKPSFNPTGGGSPKLVRHIFGDHHFKSNRTPHYTHCAGYNHCNGFHALPSELHPCPYQQHVKKQRNGTCNRYRLQIFCCLDTTVASENKPMMFWLCDVLPNCKTQYILPLRLSGKDKDLHRWLSTVFKSLRKTSSNVNYVGATCN